MTLQRQIADIAISMQKNRSLNKLVEELEKAAGSSKPAKNNPLSEAVVSINYKLKANGIFPLKFNASYFSQSSLAEGRSLELSWQRCDLLYHGTLTPLKVPKSHGPGFRISIWGDGLVQIGLGNRFAKSGEMAVKNFYKNVASDSGYLAACFEKIIDSYYFDLDWFDEPFEAESFSELKEYVRVNGSKAVNTFVRINKPLSVASYKTAEILTKTALKSFVETSPFFYSFLFNTEPKKSKTQSSMKGQTTRERLRSELMNVENKCQNEDCPIPLKHQHLETAHLVPGINELSNVVALCSVCHGTQYPKNSSIKITGLLTEKGKKKIFGARVKTKVGEQGWRLVSSHPLKAYRG